MNCISWMIGHLAWQEQRYWMQRAQGRTVVPELEELVGVGRPATIPPVDRMWDAWHTVIREADPYLDTLTTDLLLTYYQVDGKPASSDIGTALQRVIYHYWYHIGESQAVRQLLGHRNLPQFVGDIQDEAPYLPDQAVGP